MKIALIADSHDNLPLIEKAVSLFNNAGCTMMLHAGDIVSPFVIPILTKFRGNIVAVFGNNDGEKVGLTNLLKGNIYKPPHKIELDKRQIVLAHEPEKVKASDLEGVEIFIYGHTHKFELVKGKPLRINPGECGGWLTKAPTVAILETTTLSVEKIELKS